VNESVYRFWSKRQSRPKLKAFSKKKVLKKRDIKDFKKDILQKSGTVPLKSTQPIQNTLNILLKLFTVNELQFKINTLKNSSENNSLMLAILEY
jgi:hypothetical protein